jgi:hypothetical protein
MKKQLLALFFCFSLSTVIAQVGINTTTPEAQLDVRSSNQATPANTDGILIPKVDAFPVTNPTTAQNGMMVFLTTAVGLKLPGFYYWDSTTSTWIGLASSTSGWALTGNSGTASGTNFIGTTDAQALDIRTNNILRTRFTTKGQIETLNTGNSVFVGEGAGANDDLSDNRNTLIGLNAGQTNTTATFNTGIGYQALQNSTSNGATAVGYNALQNYTGIRGTAVGFEALKATTTGSSNTAVGYAALSKNTTGGNNTAMGNEALLNITTGSNNTGFGKYALLFSTTAVQNTAVGVSAMHTNTTGGSNTAMGFQAMGLNNTGNNNVALGLNALYGNTTGSNNMALGSSADVTTSGLSNASAIGYNAKVATNNSMVLGGTGADAVKVGIGTTSPSEELEVVGDVKASSLAGSGTKMVQADTNGTLTPLAAGTASQVLLGTGVWGNVPMDTAWGLAGNTGTIAGTDFIGTTDFNDFVFKTNNIERARFLKTGFMGIGVNAPSAYLDIFGNNVDSNSLLLRSGNNNIDFGASQIAFSWNGGSDYKHAIKSRHNAFGSSGNAIEFVLWNPATDGIADMGTKNVMTIDGDGNGKVGIGTVSPSKELHVIGEIRTSSLAGTGYRVVQTDDWGTIKPLAAGTASQVLLGTGVWGSVPGLTNDWSATGNSGTNPATNFLGTTDANDLVIKTNSTETARMTTAGNFGIGTNAPASRLHIKGGQIIESGTLYMNSPDNVEKILLTDWGDNGSKINTSWNFSVDYMAGSNGWDTDGNHRFFTSVVGAGFTERMRIHSNGNVGIGSTAPIQAKLVINGTENTMLSYGYLNSLGAVGTSSGTSGYSIYASGKIAATEFNAFSDERIKNIKGISNSSKDLETLNKIQITDYTFKDTIGKGLGTNKKVIAQQVKEVYPQAVSEITDVIPDIYTIAKIKDGRVILKNTLQKGDRVKLVFDNRTEVVNVLQADEHGFNVALQDEGKVFVFGREVKDFHTVDYEALSTLNISATQELIKIINQQEAQIQNLKADNADMNKRLSQTEADINEIKSILNSTVSSNAK